MSLIPMKEMLADATRGKYAVGCYNAINLEMIRGVIEAAEQEKSPVVLCHAEIHFKFTPLEKIAHIMVQEAKNARVPVSILLDHGKSFSALIKAMHLGFNAVMFDGSELSYEENVAQTKRIVEIAHVLDVCVEAELGHVTRPKSGGAEGEEDDSIVDDTSLYTDPMQAGIFIEQTQADALAVAYGTAHGLYLKKPVLDFDRLLQIRKNIDVPLVMHGGSGLSAQDFQKSIECGIQKINYYTGVAKKVAMDLKCKLISTEGDSFYHDLMMLSIQSIREDVAGTMRLFGSSGHA